MPKIVAVALAVLFSLSLKNLNAQELKMSEHEKSVVQIALQKPDGSVSAFGTGFFIAENGTVATALHVYTAAIAAIGEGRGGNIIARRASRVTKTYSWSTVELLRSDTTHDLALLILKNASEKIWTPMGGIKPLPFSSLKEVEPEAEVTVIGYFGSDLYPVSLSGRLVGATVMTVPGLGDIEEFLVSASAVPGQSGSPIVLPDGSVIGVMDSIVSVPLSFNTQPLASGLNRVVKVEHLQRLLSSK